MFVQLQETFRQTHRHLSYLALNLPQGHHQSYFKDFTRTNINNPQSRSCHVRCQLYASNIKGLKRRELLKVLVKVTLRPHSDDLCLQVHYYLDYNGC